MKFTSIALVSLLLGLNSAVSYSTGDHARHHPADVKVAQAPTDMTDGEIRKVDKDAKKLTIRHGPIQKLDMPAMTMVFQVKDPVMLDQVKTGDKVKFAAEKAGGAFTVTNIELAK